MRASGVSQTPGATPVCFARMNVSRGGRPVSPVQWGSGGTQPTVSVSPHPNVRAVSTPLRTIVLQRAAWLRRGCVAHNLRQQRQRRRGCYPIDTNRVTLPVCAWSARTALAMAPRWTKLPLLWRSKIWLSSSVLIATPHHRVVSISTVRAGYYRRVAITPQEQYAPTRTRQRKLLAVLAMSIVWEERNSKLVVATTLNSWPHPSPVDVPHTPARSPSASALPPRNPPLT